MSTTITKPATILKERDREVLSSLFAIDTRALTAIRIGLASIILFHSFTTPLPSDSGSGFDVGVNYAMVVIVPFAIMLLVGYRTRFATIVCWILYSIPLRAGYLGGGDLPLQSYMVALFLFWGAFLPFGAHLSLDSRRGAPAARPGRILSVASAGFLLQMFIIYFSAGATKYWVEWISEASALQTILESDRFASELGTAMLAFPAVLAVGSVLTVALETLGSLLLFVPGKTLQVRRVLIAFSFIAFHVGLAVFMTLERFPYVMIVLWLVFLPTSFWDRVTGRPMKAQQYPDTSRARNLTAALALFYIVVSCAFTWLYYPAKDGFPGAWQLFGKYLLIYQQWAMFSVPSSI